MKKETGNGIKDLTSFVLRKKLYKIFEKNNSHFTTLEINENQFNKKFQAQFVKKIKRG